MKNINQLLWDECCTGVNEYLLRRWFYGNMNKLCDTPSNIRGDQEGDVLKRIESLSTSIPDYEYYGGRSKVTVLDSFGWKDSYGKDLRNYLTKGLESFNIY